jgi:hypothetical protein
MEKLKPFSLKSGTSQARLLSLFLFNIVLEFLTIAVKQEKNKTDTKERIKLNFPCLQMIPYI